MKDATECEVVDLQRHIHELIKTNEATHREIVELRQDVEGQIEYLDALGTRVERMSSRENQLWATLLDAHDQLSYQLLVRRIRAVVHVTLPRNVTVVVVSKGDDELLKLSGRQACHFPQGEDGLYAGYYPADSAEAITHLEVLRTKGGRFLFIPTIAFWLLEHYGKFYQHLSAHYQRIWSDEHCIIYQSSELEPDSVGAG